MEKSPVDAEQVAWERISSAAREADPALSLAGLGLTRVPDGLKTLRYLTHLDLSGNRLTELPEWLGALTALEQLILRGNRLVQLPPSLAGLSRLAQLDAADNRLLQVPPELASLPRLSVLELGGNPHLLVPPPAIVARGSHAMLDHLRGLGSTAESAAETTLPSGIPPSDRAQDDATHGARHKAFLVGVPVLVICAVVLITAAMLGAAPGRTSPSSASLPAARAAAPAGAIDVSPNTAETATAKAPTTKNASPSSPEPAPFAGRVSTSATAPAASAAAATVTSSSVTTDAVGAYPTAAPDVDLALGQPATASSTMEDYVGSNAVDGNPDTYWESQDGTAFPQTLTIDLGGVTTVGRFDFRLPEASDWNERSETFTILGSTDGTDFFTIKPSAVYTFNANSASDDSTPLTIGPVHVRYIELSFTATNGWPAAQIGELDVYS